MYSTTMAPDQQMTISRSNRMGTPSHISKAARQVVPAFLQKLYEMVNDPKNSDLIRWSEAGDSFFVLDHERFAHDVLGRWFKHRNFSSFVRQLNMYGFHKIPHLQQGVLKSDNETEFWNFAHANFHRGQPDLLCLIQRKKTANQPGDEGTIDFRDPTLPSIPGPGNPPPANNPTLSPGQILDIHSIINGIATIKRHQTTISSELNELKRSNQLLWQDAMTARTKHQKQQDTINRIVKFLAGVFGHHTTGQHKDDTVQSNSPHAVIPRRVPRFMIEDAKRDGKGIVELDEMDILPMIETPISEPSPAPSTATSEHTSVSDFPAYGPIPPSHPPTSMTPLSTTTDDSSTTPASNSSGSTSVDPVPPISQPQAQKIQENNDHELTPSRRPSSPVIDFDPRIQGVLNQLSPQQLQQLLTSLASQSLSDPPSSDNSGMFSSSSNPNSHLTHYQPPAFDFPGSSPGSNSNSSSFPLFSSLLHLPAPTEGLVSFNPYDSVQQQERMEKQWQVTEDIDKDVNALNSSIHSLIQTFGLDPTLLDPNAPHGIPINNGPNLSNTQLPDDIHGMKMDTSPIGSDNASDLNIHMPPPDFDFDSFFNTMSASHPDDPLDYGDVTSTAFLDEVPTPANSTTSPIQNLRLLTPELGATTNSSNTTSSSPTNTSTSTTAPLTTVPITVNPLNVVNSTSTGRKRKSDIVDVEGGSALQPAASTAPTTAGKTKRRKEK